MDKRAKIALVGLGAAGAAGLAYYVYVRRNTADVQIEVEIEQTHLDWLTEKAGAHADGDVVKAFAQLVSHCMAASDDDAAAEKIFKEVRCNTCGGRKNKTSFTATVSPAQKAFMAAMVEKFSIKGGEAKCARVMLEYAMNDADEATVFA